MTALTQEVATSQVAAPPRAGISSPSRVGWSLVALFVAFSGQQVWAGSLSVPGANVAAIALILVGLVSLGLLWTRRDEPSTWTQLILLGCLAVGLGFQAALTWIFDPTYGTDAVAFDQYAAQLAIRGSNPYVHSMQPSLAMFQVPAIYHTYRLDGTAVTSLSYPAGSFLAYLPLLATGLRTQVANIVDLSAWLASMFTLWRLLPRDIRWVAGLIGPAFIYVGFVIGGLTDALFVPFVLVAVYRWDRFADRTTFWLSRWAGPVALGLAASIKQTPWFLAPYLLLGIYFEARARGLRPLRLTASYAVGCLTPFLLVNAVYIRADPSAWAKGALVPFLDPTIPDGQGLINLSLFERLGGGDLKWFTLLGVSFIAFTLLAFTASYTRLKRAWVPLVALSFFMPTRSFGSYLFMLIPAALVAATTVSPTVINPFPALSRQVKPILMAGGVALAGVAGLAISARAPLSVVVVSTRSTGQLQTLDQIRVHITNRTGRTLRPHFTVNDTDHATTFWYPRDDHGAYPLILYPHQQVTLTLQAPNTASMPGVRAALTVEAFTATPASVSVSRRYEVSTVGTRIVPDAVDAPVPVGLPVQLTVQAENEYGAPVRRAGIPITLGQAVYGQNAVFAGEASINGYPEGFSPVTLPSDTSGKAVFTIVGIQAQAEPVYFQAVINDTDQVPHGYSNQVAVQFVPRR